MWKDWLNYSRSERRGIIILFSLVCLTALFPYVYQTLYFSESPLANSRTFYKVDSFYNALNYINAKESPKFSYLAEEMPQKIEPEHFNFDPNSVSTSELVRLGLSKKQALVIENYRVKGGVFRSPSDFAKMYVVDSATYKRLKPYIQIEQKQLIASSDSANPVSKPLVKEVVYLELNSSDTLQLQKLRGVGRNYARRIATYRDLLGGFHSIDQLTEIYGFSKDIVEMVRGNVWIDTTSVTKLNVNLVTYNDLRKHPYLTDYQARAIIFYREKMGNFSTIDQILKNKLVDNTTYKKLKPYVTVN